MIIDRARFDKLDYLMSVGWGHVPSMVIEAVVDECGEIPIPLPTEFETRLWMSPEDPVHVMTAEGWAQRWARVFFQWRERARSEAKAARSAA